MRPFGLILRYSGALYYSPFSKVVGLQGKLLSVRHQRYSGGVLCCDLEEVIVNTDCSPPSADPGFILILLPSPK